jgi:hypothetical protein
VQLATPDAAQTWDEGWTAQQKREFLVENKANPGWLAGLPSYVRQLIIALVGAAWIWFAGIIIAQCTGMTDWSPISGMALLTVVLVMLLAGTGAVVGAVLIGAALCVAVTLAADMMSDLRTGHLVGAQPKRQQIVEMAVEDAVLFVHAVTANGVAGHGVQRVGAEGDLELGVQAAEAVEDATVDGGPVPVARSHDLSRESPRGRRSPGQRGRDVDLGRPFRALLSYTTPRTVTSIVAAADASIARLPGVVPAVPLVPVVPTPQSRTKLQDDTVGPFAA